MSCCATPAIPPAAVLGEPIIYWEGDSPIFVGLERRLLEATCNPEALTPLRA